MDALKIKCIFKKNKKHHVHRASDKDDGNFFPVQFHFLALHTQKEICLNLAVAISSLNNTKC